MKLTTKEHPTDRVQFSLWKGFFQFMLTISELLKITMRVKDVPVTINLPFMSWLFFQ